MRERRRLRVKKGVSSGRQRLIVTGVFILAGQGRLKIGPGTVSQVLEICHLDTLWGHISCLLLTQSAVMGTHADAEYFWMCQRISNF